MSIMRANESAQASKRKEINDPASKRYVRNPWITIKEAISNFLTKIRFGPDFFVLSVSA
uniref:Uncharacterized protein n=1 Tax=Amphimedon queenslandica TaxID=400682 RepID=A0A1X7V7H3_AMPQE